MLKEAGLVRKRLGGVKILAAGELKVALKVSAHRISAGAVAQIEAAGGSVELIGPQTADKTPRRHKKKAAKTEVEDEPKAKAVAKAATADQTGEAPAEESSEDQAKAAEETEGADEAEPEADSGEAACRPEDEPPQLSQAVTNAFPVPD